MLYSLISYIELTCEKGSPEEDVYPTFVYDKGMTSFSFFSSDSIPNDVACVAVNLDG